MIEIVKKIVNYFLFYIGWFVCIQQAAQGRPLIGPMVVTLMLIYHLISNRNVRTEITVIVSIAILGSLTDTVYQLLGLLIYTAPYPSVWWLCPPWLTAIWVLFAMCLNHSLTWMKGYPIATSVMAAFCVPFFYKGAESVGVVTFLSEDSTVLLTIGCVWLFFFPFSLYFSSWVSEKNRAKQ